MIKKKTWYGRLATRSSYFVLSKMYAGTTGLASIVAVQSAW